MAHVYHFQIGPITASRENRLDLAMSVAVGSPIQVSLFVFPVLVLLGWIIGQPLSLCEYTAQLRY